MFTSNLQRVNNLTDDSSKCETRVENMTREIRTPKEIFIINLRRML